MTKKEIDTIKRQARKRLHRWLVNQGEYCGEGKDQKEEFVDFPLEEIALAKLIQLNGIVESVRRSLHV